MTEPILPDFLNRNQPKEPAMTTPAKPKTKTIPALIARVTISIPLDINDAKSFETASQAITGLTDSLSPHSIVKVHGSAFGKMGT